MPDFSNLESLIGPGTVEAAIQFLNKGKYLVRNLKYYPMKLYEAVSNKPDYLFAREYFLYKSLNLFIQVHGSVLIYFYNVDIQQKYEI